jgi:hypothetical protein
MASGQAARDVRTATAWGSAGRERIFDPTQADVKRIAPHLTKQLARLLRRGIDLPIRENYS